MTLAYPPELDVHARARVEARLAEAEKSFAEDARATSRSGALFRPGPARAEVPVRRVVSFVVGVFEGFLWELTGTVRRHEQDWTAERFRTVQATFLDSLIENAYQRKQAGKVLRDRSDDPDDWKPLGLEGFQRRVHEELIRLQFWANCQDNLKVLAEREAQEDSSVTTARVLRAMKAEAGWTIGELAEKVRITERSVKKHLAAKTEVRDSNLRAYAMAFTEASGRQITMSMLRRGKSYP